MAWKVTVDKAACDGDGECADVCPKKVYVIRDGKAVPIHAAACIGCGVCVEVCEACAITVRKG